MTISQQLASQNIRTANTKGDLAAIEMQIPKRYRSKTLYNLTNMDLIISNTRISLQRGVSMFITGGTGSGKTHLAVGLMLEYFADHLDDYEYALTIHPSTMLPWPDGRPEFYLTDKPRPIFIAAMDLYQSVKRSYQDPAAKTETAIADRLTNTPLLCLDDLGAERLSEFGRALMGYALDRRYRDNMQTIVTSNLSMADIANKIDDRIASRLCEMASVVDLGNHDHRIKPTLFPENEA